MLASDLATNPAFVSVCKVPSRTPGMDSTLKDSNVQWSTFNTDVAIGALRALPGGPLSMATTQGRTVRQAPPVEFDRRKSHSRAGACRLGRPPTAPPEFGMQASELGGDNANHLARPERQQAPLRAGRHFRQRLTQPAHGSLSSQPLHLQGCTEYGVSPGSCPQQRNESRWLLTCPRSPWSRHQYPLVWSLIPCGQGWAHRGGHRDNEYPSRTGSTEHYLRVCARVVMNKDRLPLGSAPYIGQVCRHVPTQAAVSAALSQPVAEMEMLQ